MKAGGPYRIYPAILSQIRNPQVRYGSAQPFHVSEFISVIWRAWAEFSRRNIRTRKFLNFVRGKFRIFYFYSLNNEGRRTLSYLSRNNFPCTKFRNFLVRKSRQKFRSRSSDDAEKSYRKKFLMTWKRFQSGIPYQDRRISYLGEFCGIDTIRSSGLH
jgi:hypothetical protein